MDIYWIVWIVRSCWHCLKR